MMNLDTGKRVARVNPPDDWIVIADPEIRILDNDRWQGAKVRQGELSEKFATAIAATRYDRANRMNAAHGPRYLLSGPLECGVTVAPTR